ncbi:MAG: 50S ribosomal protein L24 [Methylotenera sp.]|jgi:large subunit ribosomal protein L24|nr:50S ribosomal protein L24 [Methylotenera sp.]MDO9233531.1 50S ribosomal protein L24 [Methylotenera sp.]MDO9282489.1 50S ribosomal protein L24 [Methylotenera sp.]MDO9389636.1 50S ribosomal protein L24 [Methylotenera sp.]MDP1595870.1 50S ribosomal protein L24 [Methylotenera sp.]
MNKIRKGDLVILNTGKDKGKQGAVVSILDSGHVIVEGLNLVKKHAKANPMKGIAGGIIAKEMPLDISNVALFNSATQKGDRVGFKTLDDGRKIRVFKSNGEAVDA